jgi:histidyl-tRNA synthetase
MGHIGVLRAILTQDEVAEEDQNIILQLMDKKEYSEAFKMVPQNCQRILEGLLALKSDNVFETIKNLKEHINGYSEAEDSADNLLEIMKLLSKTGCEIACLEPGFARGLEYYTGMIFEVYVPELGIALGGGGRYDKLIEVFGGEPTPATGVAHGLDRIALALQTQKAETQTRHSKCVAVIPVKEELKSEALKIAQMLRKSGIPTEFEIMGRKMAKALEDADKRQVDYAVIVGENELRKNSVVLRDLAKREQEVVEISKLTSKIRG